MAEYLQVRSNGQITLPAPTRRKAHIKEGDLLEAIVDPDGTIRLVPKLAVDRARVDPAETHQNDSSHLDIIDQLMTGSLAVQDFTPLSREEAHARK